VLLLLFQEEIVLVAQRLAVEKRQRLHFPFYRNCVKIRMEYLHLFYHQLGE